MGISQFGRKLTSMLPDLGFNHLIRPEPINTYNPARADGERKEEVSQATYTIFTYDNNHCEEMKSVDVNDTHAFYKNGKKNWINVDGLRKKEVYNICDFFGIDHLIAEDILSIGQRAKLDQIGDDLFCLLPMIYYNSDTGLVEREQISLVLGVDFLISFQEDAQRDVLDRVRRKLRDGNQKLMVHHVDHLLYTLLDAVVDSYYGVMIRLETRMEDLENQLLRHKNRISMGQISVLRRELMIFVRMLMPVKEMISGLVRSEHPLLHKENDKYFKDVQDHSVQATEHAENLRDMMLNLQDLLLSQINLRMNEAIRIFTIITTLLAPATVIGGIFGMNFDVIPLAHHQAGFYLAVLLMLIFPVFMLVYFRRKGWFD